MSLFSLTRAKKMADNINATERNTLAVLYNINSSKVISPQHQNYIYRHIYIYVCPYVKPYGGCK